MSFPSGAKFTSCNPATGDTVWSGMATTADAVDTAVQRARSALASWAQEPLAAREAILDQVRALIAAHADELAALIAQEVGKPLWEATTEVKAMQGKFGVSVDAYSQRCATFTKGGATTRFRPQGVVAVLGPFNFPGHLPNGHLVPALLAGNAVVFKPSEQAAAVGEKLVALFHAGGVPGDVLQVVQGGRETGAALATHAGIDGVFFTGSYAAGQAIRRATLEQPGKILALEMGGNNALLADAGHLSDHAAVASIIVQSAFITAGQRCTCARRLIVPTGAAGDALLTEVVALTARLRVARWDAEPAPFMGPVVSSAAAANVMARQDALLASGATALLACTRPDPGGAFVTPGILDVTALPEHADEEVFGPLLQVLRVPDWDAALHAVNATAYGLAAGLLSEDPARWEAFAQAVRVGILNWNVPLTGASSSAPFGGTGKSGNHRPSAFFAADYCAFPIASLEKSHPIKVDLVGLR